MMTEGVPTPALFEKMVEGEVGGAVEMGRGELPKALRWRGRVRRGDSFLRYEQNPPRHQ